MTLLEKGAEIYAQLVGRRNDYQITFSTPEGRRVLKDHLRACGAFSPSHVPGDSHSSSYNNGLRDGALRLLRQMDMDDEALMRLARERSK